MGQAKNRGSKGVRVTQALQRQQLPSPPPPRLVCNHCQATLSNVTAVDTKALAGITAAFSASCSACQEDTWAVRGEPAAVRAFYETLEKVSGQRITLGTARTDG